MRPRSTFMKRQKELARQQKQREKTARRQQRKSQRSFAEGSGEDAGTNQETHTTGAGEMTSDETTDNDDLAGDDFGAAALHESAAVAERKETP